MARTSTRSKAITPKAPLIAEELEVSQDHSFLMPSDGDARVEEEGRIEVVDSTLAVKAKLTVKAEALAFMEEPVIVCINETSNPNEANPIEFGVNGRMIVLWRGTDYIVKRKYLERMARAKTTRIHPELIVVDGVRGYRYHRKTAPTYPFAVKRDDNRVGADWLRKIMAEA